MSRYQSPAGLPGKNQYSIDAIEICIAEVLAEGGGHCDDPDRYRVSNCEWSAELEVRDSYQASMGLVCEVTPRFTQGRLDKYRSDMQAIKPLIVAHLARPKSRFIFISEEPS